MPRYRNAIAAATLLSLGPATAPFHSVGAQSALSDPAPPPPSGPLRVTSDTAEYCENLAHRIEQAERSRSDTPPQVEELATEGHQMCITGLIRSGLVRLRRALFLLRSEK